MKGFHAFLLTGIFVFSQILPAFATEPLQKLIPPASSSNTLQTKDKITDFMPGEVLVKFKSPEKGQISATSLNAKSAILAQTMGLTTKDKQPKTGIVHFEKKDADVEKLVADLKKNPDVEIAQPNYIYRLQDSSEYYGWDIGNATGDSGVNADQVWNTSTGNGVVVAVIDTGIDWTHEDLSANIWHNPGETNCTNGIDDDGNGYIDDCRGWDFVGLLRDSIFQWEDNDPMDYFGHGTHVAGTIAAELNGVGVVGVAPNAKVMAVKAFDDFGQGAIIGTTSSTTYAIKYAMENGADVINMSFGNYFEDTLQKAALDQAYSAGIVLVAAAGNEGDKGNATSYPAAYPNVIAVAATDQNNIDADFSNYGDYVDIAAPGVEILSTFPNNQYVYDNGTSMASPHVAGVAALILEKNPTLSPSDVENILGKSARDIKTPGKDIFTGNGLVDAYAALFPPKLAIDFPIPEITDSSTPLFILSSTEAGQVTFSGSCSSTDSDVADGLTVITLIVIHLI